MYIQRRHCQTARLPNLRYRGWLRSSTYMSTRLLRASTKNTFTARPCLESCAPTTDKVKKITRFFLFVLRRVQRNRKRKVGSSPAPIPSFGPGRGFRPNSGRGCKGKTKFGCAASTCFHDGTNFWYFTNFGKKEKNFLNFPSQEIECVVNSWVKVLKREVNLALSW